jgi:hypothetical protein
MPIHPEKQFFDNDWKSMEGIEDVGIEFGADREFRGTAPTAKIQGIKARRGNPSAKQQGYSNAVGISLQTTDQIWTIWESTFVADIMPMHGDIILVNRTVDKWGRLVDPLEVAERWLVQWSKRTMYGAQFLCYCSESPLNQDVIY